MADDLPWIKYQPQAQGPWAKYASAPPKENPPNAAMQPGQQVGDEKLPGFDEARRLVTSIPGGIKSGAEGIANTVMHPVDTVKNLIGKIPGAISGGVNAAVHPIDTTKKVGDYLRKVQPEQVGNMAGSAMVGGAAGKAAGVLGDVVGPSVKALQKPVSPEIKALADKGVVTTPGQRGGPKSLRDTAEQKLTSLPVGGQSIANRRAESIQKWSAEKLDDSLKDIGAKPVPTNKTGRDAYFHTYTEIQKKYNSLLPKMTGDLNNAGQGGTSLHTDLSQIRTDAAQKGNGIRPTEQKHLLSIIDNDVIARFDASGKANGKALGDIKDVLDKEIKGYKSGNNSERKVSQALEKVQAKVMDMIRRENPAQAAELKKADTAYAKFQTALLASKIGGKGQEGAFSPNQYLRATERRDPTKNKRAFGTGTAPGQKEAESASKILGNTVPDSGTPGRTQMMDMLKNPWSAGGGIAASSIMPIIYSKPVQKLLQNRALKKGGPYKPIGASAPMAGAVAGSQVDENGIAQ